MPATLKPEVAEQYHLIWTGGDEIHIAGFGKVVFSMLDLNLAERIATEFKDDAGNSLYLKKKVKLNPKRHIPE